MKCPIEALAQVRAVEELKKLGYSQDTEGEWHKVLVRYQTGNGKPFCLEKMFIESRGDVSKLYENICILIHQINDLVREIHPDISITPINEVDELTPCNVDRNKFYIRVKSLQSERVSSAE